jgi:predicted DNA binding CopG/RHH family protein
MTKENREYRVIDDPEDVPAFSTDDEEAQFWATHELGEGMVSRMEALPEGLLPTARPRTKAISMRMDIELLASVKEVAKARDVPYQTLLKQFVVERLAVETGAAETAGADDRRVGRATFPGFADKSEVCRHSEAIRQRRHVLVYSS